MYEIDLDTIETMYRDNVAPYQSGRIQMSRTARGTTEIAVREGVVLLVTVAVGPSVFEGIHTQTVQIEDAHFVAEDGDEWTTPGLTDRITVKGHRKAWGGVFVPVNS